MHKPRQPTLKYLCSKFDHQSVACFVLACILLVAIVAIFSVGAIPEQSLGWGLGFTTLLLLGSFVRPLIAMAFDGFDAVFSVCATGLIIFVVAISSWLTCFYLVTGQLSSQAPGSKILDMPTLIIALWVAATGWYVQFQLTRRSHRMTHGMSLVLGTRTNAEFQKHSDNVKRRLPNKKCCSEIPVAFFELSALCDAQLRVERDPHDKAAAEDLDTARCVESMKFLLNYYEFMSVGINLGDIEESILYETISPNVVNLYDRAEAFIKWVRSDEGGKQPLMLEHLEKVVDRWRKALKADEAAQAQGQP